MEPSKLKKICYVISEKNGKSYFNRIGVAFVNQDGSLNVKLEALPVNGEIHIRDYVPFPKGQEAQQPPPTTGEVETTSDKHSDDFPFQ
jgi:hypothetical protein